MNLFWIWYYQGMIYRKITEQLKCIKKLSGWPNYTASGVIDVLLIKVELILSALDMGGNTFK